uniref:Uncharacterized protein n=1 Tax=Tanacetum cinerariifolium TaxID=118510 RepID=A0A699L290_TANCI|nr:hypothetical protein [Tanacetum cinerariifolium]
MNLINGICLNFTYEDGKPVTFCGCKGPLNGEFCGFCNSRAGSSFAYDPTPYSYNDSPNFINPLPQPQTYSCELCGNDHHYDSDCLPRFLLDYEQEPEYLENSSNSIVHEEPDNSLSMGDEHLSTIPEIESDEVIKSSVEDLVPIPNEFEGISDDTCNVPFCDDSPPLDVLNDHFELFSDFNNDCTSCDDFSPINVFEE